MRFLKKLAGYLGIAKDDEFDIQHNAASPSSSSSTPTTTFANRKGFSVPLHRPPILVPCSSSIQAGLQGLRWFARSLKIDEDGDVADEFLEEVLPGMHEEHIPVTKIEVKYIVRPAKVRNQVLSPEGKLQHCVDNQGRLQWI